MALHETARERLLTGEELARLPDLGPCELVEGRMVPMSPTGDIHGWLEVELAAALLAWAKRTQRGRVLGGEVGIYIRRNPDTVRAADVLFISSERWARRGASTYLDVAPELVVEILSPDDRWTDVTAKLADYFSIDVAAVWIVDPRLRKVFAYRSPTDARQFAAEQVLADEELLPGFALALAELFGA